MTDPSKEAPTPPPRATVPSRGAEAVLPDRWVALAYKGHLRHTQAGLPIPEPIDLTANPSADDQTMLEVADGFTVPSNILWTMRYDEALAKGMAIDITNLATDEIQTGFDRVVVIGVKTSMDPATALQTIADLFDAHHYTRGLDLVPLGTPTNNVPGRPTPFTMKDPPAEVSFQVERVGPTLGDSAGDFDFVQLSQLFGFDYFDGPFTFLSGAVNSQRDIGKGQDMRTALWPATLGYFMRQMMNPPGFLNGNATPIFSETTFAAAKQFFHQYVSAQGPAPAFRVGAVPYGLLPAISYSRMLAKTGENADAMEVIRKLVPFWQSASFQGSDRPAKLSGSKHGSNEGDLPEVELGRRVRSKQHRPRHDREPLSVRAAGPRGLLHGAGPAPELDARGTGTPRLVDGPDLRDDVLRGDSALRRFARHGASPARDAGLRGKPDPARCLQRSDHLQLSPVPR